MTELHLYQDYGDGFLKVFGVSISLDSINSILCENDIEQLSEASFKEFLFRVVESFQTLSGKFLVVFAVVSSLNDDHSEGVRLTDVCVEVNKLLEKYCWDVFKPMVVIDKCLKFRILAKDIVLYESEFNVEHTEDELRTTYPINCRFKHIIRDTNSIG